MHFTYRTKGTCSQEILFDVDGKTVKNIEFIGGCNGNLQGISKLVEGMDIDTVIERLDGIHCGMKETSCPDQLANALKKAREKLQRKPEKHGHAAAIPGPENTGRRSLQRPVFLRCKSIAN